MNKRADSTVAGGSGRTAWASDDPPRMRPPAFAVTSTAPPEPCDMTKACMLRKDPRPWPPGGDGSDSAAARNEADTASAAGSTEQEQLRVAGRRRRQSATTNPSLLVGPQHYEDPMPRRRRERSSRRHHDESGRRQSWRVDWTPPAGGLCRHPPNGSWLTGT